MKSFFKNVIGFKAWWKFVILLVIFVLSTYFLSSDLFDLAKTSRIFDVDEYRYPRPKGRGSLIFAQDSLHPRDEPRGFFAQNRDSFFLTTNTNLTNLIYKLNVCEKETGCQIWVSSFSLFIFTLELLLSIKLVRIIRNPSEDGKLRKLGREIIAGQFYPVFALFLFFISFALSVAISYYQITLEAKTRVSSLEGSVLSSNFLREIADVDAVLIEKIELPRLITKASNIDLTFILLGYGKDDKVTLVDLVTIQEAQTRNSFLPMTKDKFLFAQNQNWILVTSLDNHEEVSILFPYLRAVIDTYFDGYYSSKPLPEIRILDQDEFAEVQKQKEDEAKNELEKAINHLSSLIDQSEDSIIDGDKRVGEDQARFEDWKSKAEIWLEDCIDNLGVSDQLCKSGARQIQEGQVAIDREREEWKKSKEELNNYIKTGSQNLGFLQDKYKDFINHPILPESTAGIFHKPNVININSQNNPQLDLIVSTLIHEYLHYYSSSASLNLDHGFEEGLTEFYTSKIAERFTDIDFYETYDMETAIVALLNNLFTDQVTADAYLRKDLLPMAGLIDSKYGEETFKKIEDLVLQMYYLPDPEKTRILEQVTDLLQGST